MTPLGRTHKAGLNAAAGLLDSFSVLVMNFIVTPILVGALGTSAFGMLSVLNRLSSYMLTVDGRATLALKWFIAHNQDSDDVSMKRRAIGSAIAVWLCFLPLLLIGGALIIALAPALTKAPPEMHGSVRLACLWLVLLFLFSGFLQLPAALLRGMNMEYKRLGVAAGLTILGGLVTIALVRGAGGQLPTITAVRFAVSIASGLLLFAIARRHVTWLGIIRPRRAELMKFLRLSISFFVWILVLKLVMESDVIILALMDSTVAVSHYALTATLVQAASSLILVGVASMMPGLGGLVGSKAFGKAASLRIEGHRACWLLGFAAGAVILLLNRSFMNLWIGLDCYAGPWVTILTVVMMIQFTAIHIDGLVIDLTLDLRRKIELSLVAALISILLAAILTPPLGIPGLCLGMVMGRLILSIAYPRLIHRAFERPAQPQTIWTLRMTLVTVLCSAAAAWAGTRILVPNWLWLAVSVAAAAPIFFGIAFVTGFSIEERRAFLQRVRTMSTMRFGARMPAPAP